MARSDLQVDPGCWSANNADIMSRWGMLQQMTLQVRQIKQAIVRTPDKPVLLYRAAINKNSLQRANSGLRSRGKNRNSCTAWYPCQCDVHNTRTRRDNGDGRISHTNSSGQTLSV